MAENGNNGESFERNCGRFVQGNPGGPGRPRKRKELSEPTLRDIAETPTGVELYLAAMMIEDRNEWMEKVERDFNSDVALRVRRVVSLSELAWAEIVRRLRDMAV